MGFPLGVDTSKQVVSSSKPPSASDNSKSSAESLIFVKLMHILVPSAHNVGATSHKIYATVSKVRTGERSALQWHNVHSTAYIEFDLRAASTRQMYINYTGLL
jgi:hypothetical protein